jgi:hypothetical protein
VCYGGEFGPDLEELARFHGLTNERLIDLHTKPAYSVYMLGFAPGFPYLAGLHRQLHTPRRSSPRKCRWKRRHRWGADGCIRWRLRADGTSSAEHRSRCFDRTITSRVYSSRRSVALPTRRRSRVQCADSWEATLNIEVIKPDCSARFKIAGGMAFNISAY